jgi:hypothetical protein
VSLNKKSNRKPPLVGKTLASSEIVTIAVYLLGGDRRYVDTEDVAIRASELAPGRFSWRKYKDQINLEIVRVYLSDAKKVEHGQYLQGSGTEGWMLTSDGLTFAQKAAMSLDPALQSRTPMSQVERRRLAKERQRLLATEAYAKYSQGRVGEISRREVEGFFRLDDYVVGAVRERKIERLRTMFADDEDLTHAVDTLAEIIRRQ